MSSQARSGQSGRCRKGGLLALTAFKKTSEEQGGEKLETRRILNVWNKIQTAERTEQELLGKLQVNKIIADVPPSRNIHKCVKEDLQKVMF